MQGEVGLGSTMLSPSDARVHCSLAHSFTRSLLDLNGRLRRLLSRNGRDGRRASE